MSVYSIKKATKVEYILNQLIFESCVTNSKVFIFLIEFRGVDHRRDIWDQKLGKG